MKKFLSSFLLLTMLISLVCIPTSAASEVVDEPDATATTTTVGLNVQKHTATDIQAFVNSHPSSAKEPTFEKKPSLTGTITPGVLSKDTIKSALNTINQIRYIAGLGANVTEKKSYSEKANAAALVIALNDKLSHNPDRPAAMKNAKYNTLFNLGKSGAGSCNLGVLYQSFHHAFLAQNGWIPDADSYNTTVLGHRRWIINPSLGSVGLGYANTFYALYVFDTSAPSKATQVAWPAQTMPVQYFDASHAWSLSLGTSTNIKNVSVKLVRKSDGKTWNFSSKSSNGYFNVNNDGYGTRGCVIFRPDGLSAIKAGDVFNVTVTVANGTRKTNYAYSVNFFDLNGSNLNATNPQPTKPPTPNNTTGNSQNSNQNTTHTTDNATGLVIQNGVMYFYKNGKKQKNCVATSLFGEMYYCEADGHVVKEGWIKVNGQNKYYAAGLNGMLATGLTSIGSDGKMYYFSVKDAHLMKGGIVNIGDGKQYYVSAQDGHVMKNGWARGVNVVGKPGYSNFHYLSNTGLVIKTIQMPTKTSPGSIPKP